MINRLALQDAIAAAEAAIASVMSLMMTYIPTIWPPFEVLDGGFYHEGDYDRNGNTGHGHGLSRQCTEDGGAVTWRFNYEVPGQAWQFWRAAGFPGLLDILDPLSVDGIFDPFGRGRHSYDRDRWHAGSVDVEAFNSVINRVRLAIGAALETLHPLLIVSQLGQYTGLLVFRTWDWVTYTGFDEHTLEVFAGRFEWDATAIDLCPHVLTLPPRIWDGFAAEMLARRELAIAVIESLQWLTTDGVERTIRDELFNAVTFWRKGSQTRRRGP